MSHEYRLISADSHLEIDTRYWRHRVVEKHRDRVPRMVRTELGGDRWVVEGEYTTEVPLDLYAGKGVQSGNDRWTPFGQRYEDTPGTGTAQQRVLEQDQDGIDAEVLFQSSASRWWRNIRDDDAYTAVLRGYNAWLAEEYCAVAPDRLIGVGALPMSNVDDAVAEMEHCKKLGLKSVALRAFPSNNGYPAAEDDRFWAASLDLEMPVCIHVELDRTGERNGPMLLYPKEPPQLRKDSARAPAADFVRQVARFHQLGGLNVIQMILHGLFDRFPNLKVYFAETQAGWIPSFLESPTSGTSGTTVGRKSYLAGSRSSTACPANTSNGTSIGGSCTTASASRCATTSGSTGSCGRPTSRTRSPSGRGPGKSSKT
jgi:predicted TIM-barrel fold metal-dependent hydrolase